MRKQNNNKKNCKEEQLFYYSMNSHCPVTVSINAQIGAAEGHSDWRMYCCYNYNKSSNYHPFTYRVVYNGDLNNFSVCG